MWKPVTIKPNDQSLCGRRIKGDGWRNIYEAIILGVGKEKVFLRVKNKIDNTKPEEIFDINHKWLIYEVPE